MMKKIITWAIGAIVALSGFVFANDLNVRQLTITNDVASTHSAIARQSWFDGESVKFDLFVKRGSTALDTSASGLYPVWYVCKPSDLTTAYVLKTGTVSTTSGHLAFSLSPSEANIPFTNGYVSQVKLYQTVTGSNKFVGVVYDGFLDIFNSPLANGVIYTGAKTNVIDWGSVVETGTKPYATPNQLVAVSNCIPALPDLTPYTKADGSVLPSANWSFNDYSITNLSTITLRYISSIVTNSYLLTGDAYFDDGEGNQAFPNGLYTFDGSVYNGPNNFQLEDYNGQPALWYYGCPQWQSAGYPFDANPYSTFGYPQYGYGTAYASIGEVITNYVNQVIDASTIGTLQTAINNHINNQSNPHNVTAAQVNAMTNGQPILTSQLPITPAISNLDIAGTMTASNNLVALHNVSFGPVAYLDGEATAFYSATPQFYSWYYAFSNSVLNSLNGWTASNVCLRATGSFNCFGSNGFWFVSFKTPSSSRINYITSPYLPNGASKISFYYSSRNLQGNNAFTVSTSPNNITYTVITTVANNTYTLPNWGYVEVPLTLSSGYVRIDGEVNAVNAQWEGIDNIAIYEPLKPIANSLHINTTLGGSLVFKPIDFTPAYLTNSCQLWMDTNGALRAMSGAGTIYNLTP